MFKVIPLKGIMTPYTDFFGSAAVLCSTFIIFFENKLFKFCDFRDHNVCKGVTLSEVGSLPSGIIEDICVIPTFVFSFDDIMCSFEKPKFLLFYLMKNGRIYQSKIFSNKIKPYCLPMDIEKSVEWKAKIFENLKVVKIFPYVCNTIIVVTGDGGIYTHDLANKKTTYIKKVEDGREILQIAVASYQPYAPLNAFFILYNNGKIYVRGGNKKGQLAHKIRQTIEDWTLNSNIPKNVIKIFPADKRAFFLTKKGDVYQCGDYIGKKHKNKPDCLRLEDLNNFDPYSKDFMDKIDDLIDSPIDSPNCSNQIVDASHSLKLMYDLSSMKMNRVFFAVRVA